jgi:hypothetical protein
LKRGATGSQNGKLVQRDNPSRDVQRIVLKVKHQGQYHPVRWSGDGERILGIGREIVNSPLLPVSAGAQRDLPTKTSHRQKVIKIMKSFELFPGSMKWVLALPNLLCKRLSRALVASGFSMEFSLPI